MAQSVAIFALALAVLIQKITTDRRLKFLELQLRVSHKVNAELVEMSKQLLNTERSIVNDMICPLVTEVGKLASKIEPSEDLNN